MGRYQRNTPRNYGGSLIPGDGTQEYKPQKFQLTEKIKEMLKYGMPLVDAFPRRNRKLADILRDSMLTLLELSVRLEKKYHKKTTVSDMDIQLALLREFIVLASDKSYCGEKFAPPLTLHQRDVWSRYNDEIGKMIGGYIKYIDGSGESKSKDDTR